VFFSEPNSFNVIFGIDIEVMIQKSDYVINIFYLQQISATDVNDFSNRIHIKYFLHAVANFKGLDFLTIENIKSKN
jgi:hypothetical protein